MSTTRGPFLFSMLLFAAGCGGNDDPAGANPSGGTGGAQTGGSGGQTGGDGGTGQGGSGGAGTGGGSGGTPSFEGYTRVDSAAADAIPGSPHVAIAPDGTIYVVWAENTSGVVLARSTDGGQSFEPEVVVNGTAKPLVSMARHPYVVATDSKVAVSFNDEDGAVYLHTSPAAGPLSFGAATMIGTDVTTDFRDFPKAVFLADGSLGVAWHGYPATGARIFVSLENDAWAANPASSGAPGLPCECCPLDIQQLSGGNLLLVFRNNDANTREMWSARAPANGAFDDWTQISTSEGFVATCPMMGPRLAETDSALFAVWSSRGASTAGAVFTASSSNAGGDWSPSAAAGDFMADEPTIAAGPSGTLYVTGATGNNTSAMIESTNGGQSWSPAQPLESPDGALKVPQAAGGAGVAALVAVTTANNVWFRRME
jgi:hypothetical protein